MRLTRQEMDIFNAVWRHRPFVVSHDRIVIQAFDPGADVEDNHIRVVLFSINKKIEKLGILIRNVPGEGYRGVLTAV